MTAGGSTPSTTTTTLLRLLTSVAIIGRENEPIYLLGDLWDCNNKNDGSCSSPNKTNTAATAAVSSSSVVDGDGTSKSTVCEINGDEATQQRNNNDTENASSANTNTKNSPPNKGRGLFGRIMKKNDDTTTSSAIDKGHQRQQLNNNDVNDEDEDEDDDPFGFFETNFSNPLHHQPHQHQQRHFQQQQQRMSLTQQLVLHASLDIFEERASSTRTALSGRRNSSGVSGGVSSGGGGIGRGSTSSAGGGGGGGVRWRTPGTDSATSMYMGLLCRVEERWSVYGYLTNTGIKFLAVVEDIHSSSTSFDNDDELFHYPPLPSWIDEEGGMMEAETKKMKKVFTQLHDLYVQYTMNPFSRLRSPICSAKFDDGVITLARSFNGIVEGRGGARSPKSSPVAARRGENDDGGRKSKEDNGLSWV